VNRFFFILGPPLGVIIRKSHITTGPDYGDTVIFDYFTDKLFVTVMKRLFGFLVCGGELVIGNFSPSNPSRQYMEFSEWLLHHRSEDDLLELANRAGIPRTQTFIDSEPERVNLFLHAYRH
jgi:hypothetical protein